MAFFFSCCNSLTTRIEPSPHAISMPTDFRYGRTVPAFSEELPSPTFAFKMVTRMSLKEEKQSGYGVNARIFLSMTEALSFQSIFPSSF